MEAKNKYPIITYLCIFILAISAYKSVAQNSQINADNYIYTPTSNAWSFMRYGNTNATLYTGTLNQDISVYVYKDQDFEIPISLNYASNGLCPNRQSGEIGLGWFLSVGGIITREIRGVPDENRRSGAPFGFYQMYKSTPNNFEGKKEIMLLPDLDEWGSESNINSYGTGLNTSKIYLYQQKGDPFGSYEGEPDIFHFNFLGYQGSFQLNYNGGIDIFNTNVGRHEIKIDSLGIERMGSTTDRNGQSVIVISTGNGYKYVFGGKPSNLDSSFNAQYTEPYQDEDEILLPTTAWHLSKIIAPNGAEVIFTYKPKRPIYINFSPTCGQVGIGVTGKGFSWLVGSSNMDIYTAMWPATLESININKQCEITLNYTPKTKKEKGNNQIDFINIIPELNSGTGNQGIEFQQALTSIVVTNLLDANKTLKTCILEHKYTNGNPKMLLKSVKISGGENYEMSYYSEDESFPAVDTYAIDAWGYWNDKASKASFIPTCNYGTGDLSYQETITGDSRDPSPTKSIYGMLKRIKYPTGGVSDFTYEAHDYNYAIGGDHHSYLYRNLVKTNKKQAGGLRIAKIVDYNAQGNNNVRNFYYTLSSPRGEESSGQLLHSPRYRLTFKTLHLITNNTVRYRIDMPMFNFNSLDNTHIAYSNVFEVLPNGHINHSYYNYNDLPDSTTLQIITGTYTDIITNNRDIVHRQVMEPSQSFHSGRGKLKYKKIYDSLGNLASEETYNYRYFSDGGLVVFKYGIDMFYKQVLDGSNYSLDDVIKTTYTNKGAITDTTSYIYNSAGQVVETRIKDSKNTTRITYDRYSWDLSPQLVAKGIRSAKMHSVSTVKHLDNKEYIIASQEFEYNTAIKTVNPVRIKEAEISLPLLVQVLPENKTFSILNTLSKNVTDLKYNNKNRLIELSYPNGMKTSFIWDKNNMYPLAILDNISVATLKQTYPFLNKIDIQPLDADLSQEQINMLRKHPGTSVTSLKYKPLVGLMEKTDPRGVVSSFEYDTNFRLQNIKDHNGNILKFNNYHFQGQ